MNIKPLNRLTLRDKLSRLTYAQANKHLGPDASSLLSKGGSVEIDVAKQVLSTDEQFQITFPSLKGDEEPIVVTLSLHPSYRDRLQVVCSHEGKRADLYRAATLSLILEEKTMLGLAKEPDLNSLPWEMLQEQDLEKRALAERAKRAADEKMKVKSTDKTSPWTEYTVTNPASGKAYRVALRSLSRGHNFCSCPDFRKNLLGTCKHVLAVQTWAQKRFNPKELQKSWKPAQIAVYAKYDGDLRLGVERPSRLSNAARALLAPWEGRLASSSEDFVQLYDLLRHLASIEEEVLVYPDAEEILSQALHQKHLSGLVGEIRKNPSSHPLLKELLHTKLLPYQLDGIAFAAGAGRAILADEMGLGKTIQGVGVAEFLARHSGIQRVLVVCPASLKSQWRLEITRFCDRTVQLVTGQTSERAAQYSGGAFFTVCNYEQVLRDYLDIERTTWDLIILDEAQRIKNWEAKTSGIIKSLRSRYALVLTGTPLENRIDDLYSITEFIDDRRLGPAYLFFHGHRTTTESGKVLGYKNLDTLREKLKPILLRRTRASIALDLPPRTTEIVRIQATEEQSLMHGAHMKIVQTITRKPFISEMDLLRLQKALLMARMSANSTFLVDKQEPAYSSKLERIEQLLEMLCAEPERKIIVFTEWTTMLNLIEPILKKLNAGFVRLDGSVPQKKRQQLVTQFQEDPDCRTFLTTNAGSTGLNLQAADTVINVDLPWNPALLEQRIARAHRMGQKRKVHAYLLVTEGTIEDNLLSTLSAKHELAAAVLDPDSDLREVQMTSGIEELKRRLEVLLGAKPEAAPDMTALQRVQAEQGLFSDEDRKAKASEAAGQMLTGALGLMSALLPQSSLPSAATNATADALATALQHSVQTTADGKSQLTFTLPNQDAVAALATALARFIALASPPPALDPEMAG